MFVDRPKHCPVCLEQKFSTVVDCGDDFDPNMIKEIWVSSPHEFYFPFFKCINCETYYTQRYVDELEIPKLYSLLKDNLFGVDEDTYFQIQDTYAAIIKKYFCNGQTQTKIDYFELGPDHGVLRKIIGDKVFVEGVSVGVGTTATAVTSSITGGQSMSNSPSISAQMVSSVVQTQQVLNSFNADSSIMNTVGTQNTAVGNTDSGSNVAVGSTTTTTTETTTNTTVASNTSGDNNTAVGNTIGTDNVAVGETSGMQNTAVGEITIADNMKMQQLEEKVSLVP